MLSLGTLFVLFFLRAPFLGHTGWIKPAQARQLRLWTPPLDPLGPRAYPSLSGLDLLGPRFSRGFFLGHAFWVTQAGSGPFRPGDYASRLLLWTPWGFDFPRMFFLGQAFLEHTGRIRPLQARQLRWRTPPLDHLAP